MPHLRAVGVTASEGGTLRFAATAADAAARSADRIAPASDADGATVWLVLDPTWTPNAADAAAGWLALRAVAGRVLAGEDLFPTTTRLLDDWADASGVVDAMTIDGTSFWYRRRLWAWRWLHERLIWVGILADIARDHRLEAVELPGPDESALRDVIHLLAERDGLTIVRPPPDQRPGDDDAHDRADRPDVDGDPAPASARAHDPRGSADPPVGILVGTLRSVVRWTRLRPIDRQRARLADRRAAADARIDALAAEGPGRIVAIIDPAALQPVSFAGGQRAIDPFLGPVLQELVRTPFEPITVELGSRAGDDATWARLSSRDGARSIAGDSLERRFGDPADTGATSEIAKVVEIALEAMPGELVFAGIDLARSLKAGLIRFARSVLPARLREVARATRLLQTLRPAALLLVDEYGRTEWLAAARQVGIPVAAVQHGIIHPFHPGYQHRGRPAARPIPARTYVFGDHERRLLLELGGYREDEVIVAGSPRLDVVAAAVQPEELARIRAEMGCRTGDRLLVVTTTFAAVYRRFHTPVAIGTLFDQLLTDVRVVIKLHPGEADGDLYRDLLQGLATSADRPPIDLTIVKRVDLYRLLAAADAHLGLYSTVLTEAVAVGTPNLLAATQASSDLLGYVQAGVAVPIRTAADLRAAIETPPRVDPGARRAFLDDHFLPGRASERIVADLHAWLGPA